MKKLINYSLLLSICSLIAFGCSKEDEMVKPVASKNNSINNLKIIGGYDVGCLNYDGTEWSFEIDGPGNVQGAGLSHLNIEILDCDGIVVPLAAGDISAARIVVGGNTYNMPGDFILEYTDGSCPGVGSSTGIVKFEIVNASLGDILKGATDAVFYFTLTDGTQLLSGANIVIKTGLGCFEDFIGTCQDYCDIVPSGQCTRTQGYWKTHGPAACGKGNNANAWNVNSMMLGSGNYSDVQLCSIFNTAVGKGNKANGLLILAHQLIAAKLNVANGNVPSDPTDLAAIQAAIIAADNMIGGLIVPPVGTGYLAPSAVSSLAGTLDAFNNSGSQYCD